MLLIKRDQQFYKLFGTGSPQICYICLFISSGFKPNQEEIQLQIKMKYIVFILFIAIGLSCPNNCVDCDPSASICFACGEGFQLNVLGTCVDSNTIPFCNLYGPTNQCFSCRATYTISNDGKCLKDYSACLMYDPSDETKCIECGFGTTLRGNACAGAINCNSNTSATCSSCLPGYSLRNGNCVDNTGNCKTVGTNGVCTLCNQGFNLVGYACITSNMTVYGCYIYDSSGFCQLCKSGFNLYQGNCLLPSQIQLLQQGLTQLSTILSQRSTVSVITTKTVTTTTTTAGPTSFGSNDFGGFGGSGGFGSEGGFGSDSSSFGFDNGGFSSGHHTIENCLSYDEFSGDCISCIPGYYLSSNQCIQVSVFCNTYDGATGSCLTCKYGIVLFNSQCTDPNCLNQQINGCLLCKPLFSVNSNNFCALNDPNCLRVQSNGCAQCAQGFYSSPSRTCAQLPSGCSAVAPGTTTCSQCSAGFQLSNGMCTRASSVTTVITTTTTTSSITIPFCASQTGPTCNQCVIGYQLSNNQCILIVVLPANCQTQDPSRPGFCLTCNSGFTNNNGACVQTQSPSTPFCQSYNLLTGRCIACIDQYMLSGSLCVPNSNGGSSGISSGSTSTITTTTTSSSSSSSGSGSSNGGAVIISNGGSSNNRDSNCMKYNGAICSACSNRYYVGPNSLCVPINPLCNTYNSSGACLSCYPGYAVSGTICIVSNKQSDPNCKSYTAGGSCASCYSGFYLNQAQSLCVALSPLCKTHNLTNGFCTSCFPGYNLNSNTGNCGLASLDNCQKNDPVTKLCVQCLSKFYLDSSSKCRQMNPLCKTANQNNGACITCYQGYVLSGDVCIIGGATNSDVNCQNFTNGACQQCYSGYFLNTQGKCAQNNPLCRTSDKTGACLTCFPGYRVVDRNCSSSTSATSSSDVNCKSTDQSGVCTSCYSGYFLTQGMVCQKMDALCKSYTSSFSACASCYDGYLLSGGQCLLSTQVTSSVTDPYCALFQGTNCLNCSSGYYVSQSGICTAPNPLCQTYDMTTGACLSCYQGYSLSGTTCIVTPPLQIPFCNQVVGFSCVSCMDRYYVNNGGCSLVSQLCDGYDMSNGLCLSCIPGYVFQQSQCIFPSLGIDPQCAYYVNSYCTRCTPGYAVINYVCSPLDSSCTQYDPATNTCKACSQGKIPQGPSCI